MPAMQNAKEYLKTYVKIKIAHIRKHNKQMK